MNQFMTQEMLTSFAGLTLAVGIIVQFTKSMVKKRFAFIISLLLTFLFANSGFTPQGLVLTVLNAILVTMSAIGGYEIFADPKAQKKRL